MDLVTNALERRADINATDNMGWTALMWAVAYDRLSVVKRLVSRCDVNVDAAAKDGTTALSIAKLKPRDANAGILDRAYYWVEYKHEHPTECPSAREVLEWCSRSEFAPEQGYIFIETLSDGTGPDDVKDAETGETCVMRAAGAGGNETLIDYMREHGADINRQDKKGLTALMHAVLKGRESTVAFLLKDPQLKLGVQAADGRTALMMAESSGDRKVYRLLKEAQDGAGAPR
jgi:ankyrin repeat protein